MKRPGSVLLLWAAGLGGPCLGQTPAPPAPAASVPAASVPAASVPAASVPAASVPAASVPAASVPAASVPAASVPAASVPAASVPAASVPAASVPAASVPAASVPAVVAGPPDVVALVFPQPGGSDRVDVTYAFTVPHAQAASDLAALRQASGWAVAGPRISTADAPTASRVGPMTSIAFQAPGVVQSGQALPVAPFVRAFRAYKRLTLVFFAGPGFQFQGPRPYADKDIRLAVSQAGASYTYQVQVLNPRLGRLSPPAAGAGPAGVRPGSPWRVGLGVLGAAAAAGLATYLAALRLTAGPGRRPGPRAVTTEAVKTTEKAEIRG